MTVKELIEELQKHNPHMYVMFMDWDNGETDIAEVRESYVGLNRQLVLILSD